jgi:hypothetical protein
MRTRYSCYRSGPQQPSSHSARNSRLATLVYPAHSSAAGSVLARLPLTNQWMLKKAGALQPWLVRQLTTPCPCSPRAINPALVSFGTTATHWAWSSRGRGTWLELVAHDIVAMRFRRLAANFHLGCGFFRAFALGEELPDLSLSRRQRLW